MTADQGRIRELYEISLAVGHGNGLRETAQEALSAYLRRLNCTAGAVLRRRDAQDDGERQNDTGYEQVAAVPADPTVDDGYTRAVEWLQESDEPTLPTALSVGSDTHAHLLDLPEFGVLVLVTTGDRIDTETVGALAGINRKLADACLAEEVERELRTQRDRLEAVVETVSEPIVRVVTHDGEPVVHEVNSAFETTFGCDRQAAQGASLDTLLTADTTDGRVNDTTGGRVNDTTGDRASDADRRASDADGRTSDADREAGDSPSGVTGDGGNLGGVGGTQPSPGAGGVWGGADTPAEPDTSWVESEVPVRREVRRQTTDGERVFSLRSVPIPSSEEGIEQFGLYIDITEQRRRQRTLERLYRAAGEFFDAPSREAVCRRGARVAADVLDFSLCGVHLYDREGRALEPVATRGVDGSDVEQEQLRYTDRDSVVWEAYQESEPVIISDLASFDGNLPNEDTPVRSALVLPLGNHGVFVASAPAAEAFDDSDQYFGKLLARMLQTALDRTGREQALRSIQSATRSLVTATDAATVAEQLVAYTSETIGAPYVGVWRYEPGEQLLCPVAQTDETEALLDQVPTFGPSDSIAWEVFSEGSPRIVDDIDSVEEAYDTDSPIRSEILVPLGEYGVLAAGSRLADDFSRTEFEFLQTLAASAESALQIVGKQQELNVLDEVLARILRHNVRNDLNVIRGRAELLASEASDTDHAQRIVDTADEILSTATNAQQIRRVVDRRGEFVSTQADALVRSAVGEVADDYPDAEIGVGPLPAVELEVHPHFEYAIRHAVENGVEHQSGEPHVVVRAATVDTGVVIEIEDDGPGVPASELDPLAAGEETQLVHGSGAGLWIVDRVVEYSGGTVEFDSSESGTVVRLIVDQATN